MTRRIIAIALGVTLGCSALLTQLSTSKEPNKKNPNSKLDLTPQSFQSLHTLIRPHDNEWRHLKIEWMTDVVAARKKAVAEDKPMVILYTGGAGYNEPLGVC